MSGARGAPGRGSGRVSRRCAGSGLPGGPWPWQPRPGCGQHGLSKGALFPVGALQLQPAGFSDPGRKGGQRGGGGLLVRKCHSGSPPPPPQACFLEAPVSTDRSADLGCNSQVLPTVEAGFSLLPFLSVFPLVIWHMHMGSPLCATQREHESGLTPCPWAVGRKTTTAPLSKLHKP